jgi:hypothetical protein
MADPTDVGRKELIHWRRRRSAPAWRDRDYLSDFFAPIRPSSVRELLARCISGVGRSYSFMRRATA